MKIFQRWVRLTQNLGHFLVTVFTVCSSKRVILQWIFWLTIEYSICKEVGDVGGVKKWNNAGDERDVKDALGCHD